MSSIALGLAFSSPLLFLLKRIPAPPVEPGVYFGYNTKRRTSFGLSAVCEYSVVREFDTAPKGKTAVLHLQICISKPRYLGSKNPDKIGVFAEHIFFMFLLWRRRRDSNSRTLLRVTRFPVARPRPTRRLLQVVRVQSVLCCFHKQPLHNSMSDGKNQDIFQKKDEFFCFAEQGGKKGGIPALFIRCHVKFAVTHASPCLTSSPANGCSVPCPRQAA